jgi:hypothetical protein
MQVSALRPFHVQEWINRQTRVKSPASSTSNQAYLSDRNSKSKAKTAD